MDERYEMLVIPSSNALQSLDNHHKKLVGEVLTLIEASVHENQTSIALKIMVKKAIWRVNQDMKNDMNSMSTIMEELKANG